MTDDASEFGGTTFDEQRDGARLKVQLDRVRTVMFDGQWRTLDEIAAAIEPNPPVASVSARLRDLRKPKFGAYDVEKRVRIGHRALWEYRVNFNGPHGKTRSEQAGAPL